MARPIKPRRLCFNPGVTYFKPRAVPLSLLKEVDLRHDELEVLKLCDCEGMEQKEAARKMNVSQSTLQRTLASARQKVAEAVVKGKAIRIVLK